MPAPSTSTSSSAIISEEKVFDNVNDLLAHLSAPSAATPSSSQQQQRATPRRKRRATASDPSDMSPSVEERILEEMTLARTAATSVNATFSKYVLAVLDDMDTQSAKRARGEIYRILNE